MNKYSCAPGKYDADNNTCFSMNELTELCIAYNKHASTNMLGRPSAKSKYALIKINGNKRDMLINLHNRFENICNGDDYCITKQDFMNALVKEMRNTITENTFRTTGPEKSNEWLDNVQITKIMKQYEAQYPTFFFVEAVPLDCDVLPFCSLHKFNFKKQMDRGIDTIGIVYNLDKYGKGGSHWVALYINMKTAEIYYCDSTGNPPLDNILNMINAFKSFSETVLKKQPIYKYNKKRYQMDSSECGIYSCNFIIRKLQGEKFEDIIKDSLAFKDINSCRNAYFINKHSQADPHPKCDYLNV